MRSIEVLVDGAHGIYVPKYFADMFGAHVMEHQPELKECIETLREEPDEEGYWDAWDTALSNVVLRSDDGHRCMLYQDGDLFAYCPELMTVLEAEEFGYDVDLEGVCIAGGIELKQDENEGYYWVSQETCSRSFWSNRSCLRDAIEKNGLDRRWIVEDVDTEGGSCD
jgi:hypothetical protein